VPELLTSKEIQDILDIVASKTEIDNFAKVLYLDSPQLRAERSISGKDMYYLINGGKLDGPYKNITPYQTDDKKITAYLLEVCTPEDNGLKIESNLNIKEQQSVHYLMINNEMSGPYDSCIVHGFLSDGSLLYSYTLEGSDFLLAGDLSYGPYQKISKIVVSKANNKFAYSVDKDGKNYIMSEGMELGPFENLQSTSFAATGEFLFLYTFEGSEFYISFKGMNYGPFGEIQLRDVFQSSDGRIISFSASENNINKNYVIVNDKVIQGFLSEDCGTAYILRSEV